MNLSKDEWVEVFSFLNIQDNLNLSLVSHDFNEFSKENSLWFRYLKPFYQMEENFQKKNWKQECINNVQFLFPHKSVRNMKNVTKNILNFYNMVYQNENTFFHEKYVNRDIKYVIDLNKFKGIYHIVPGDMSTLYLFLIEYNQQIYLLGRNMKIYLPSWENLSKSEMKYLNKIIYSSWISSLFQSKDESLLNIQVLSIEKEVHSTIYKIIKDSYLTVDSLVWLIRCLSFLNFTYPFDIISFQKLSEKDFTKRAWDMKDVYYQENIQLNLNPFQLTFYAGQIICEDHEPEKLTLNEYEIIVDENGFKFLESQYRSIYHEFEMNQ